MLVIGSIREFGPGGGPRQPGYINPQNYLRGETISAANARLVDYHATLPLVARWGGGDVASADGLRFVVPIRTINAGPNPRYFGTGRGVTYLNFISDQYAGFSGLVIPGTLRDSVYILEGLLQNDTSLRPVQIMTDTASYSDLVFIQRPGLWFVPSTRLSIQPAARRCGQRSILARRCARRLRFAERTR